MENYFLTFVQHINEAIVGALIFQTELLFRVYYGTAYRVFPSEGNVPQKVAFLFDDIENNWKKEECKLMVLIWAIRNTIHTGGIFFKEDCIREYRGMKFELRYGFPVDLSPIGDWFELLAAMVDAMFDLVRNDRIRRLGFIEHPNFKAVGK